MMTQQLNEALNHYYSNEDFVIRLIQMIEEAQTKSFNDDQKELLENAMRSALIDL
jgi:hypothetical protein